ERPQALLARGFAVHQHQRQAHAVALAQRQRLPDDDLEERTAVARLDERLRTAQPHRRGQATVQLDHRDVIKYLRIGLRELIKYIYVADRLEFVAWQHRRLSAHQSLVRAAEAADRLLGLIRLPHLLL